MRLAELSARALLGGLAMEHLEMVPEVSPNPAALLARQSCNIGFTTCGTGCMPIGGVCCAALGRAAYCDPGYYCMTGTGCCPIGKTCTGVSGSCDAGKVLCNTGCMPANGVCCPDGGYCDQGYACTTDGKCRVSGSDTGGGGSSGGGGSGGGGGGGGGGSSCDAGRELCDTNYCIPTGGVCCGFGLGKYCDEGYYCLPNGCCKNGRTCSGSPTTSDGPPLFTTTTSSRLVLHTSSPTTKSPPTTTDSEDFPSGGDNGDGGSDDFGGTTSSSSSSKSSSSSSSTSAARASPAPTGLGQPNAAPGVGVPVGWVAVALGVVGGVAVLL